MAENPEVLVVALRSVGAIVEHLADNQSKAVRIVVREALKEWEKGDVQS